jgi:PAT family beta-lactamase induction signal transducer AmpG
MFDFKQYFTHKYALLISLYSTQFMGIGFIYTAVPAILRKENVPLDQISYVYAIGLFWTVKFFWAPLIDRYNIGGFGRYRGWIMLLQSLMVITLLVAAVFDMPKQYSILLGIFALLAFFSSTQDIAADALNFSLLEENERGMGGAIQTAGAMLGNLIGAGLVLVFYNTIGWSGALILLSFMTSFSLFHVYFTRIKVVERCEKSIKSIEYARLWTFFSYRENRSWLFVISIFYMGLSISYVLVNPMLVDMGWSLEKIGSVSSIFGSIFSIVGALFVGLIVNRLGKKAAMLVTGIATLLATVGLLVPLHFYPNDWILFLAVMLIFIGYGGSSTVVYMGMMDNSREETAGTDFTLQFSLVFTFGFSASGISLSLAEVHGYSPVLLGGAGVSIISLALIYFYQGFYEATAITNEQLVEKKDHPLNKNTYAEEAAIAFNSVGVKVASDKLSIKTP